MGLFGSKKEDNIDLSFINKYIEEIKQYNLYLNEDEKEKLNSNNLVERLKTALDFMTREFGYWEKFKENYPVAFFAVTPDRKFIEWNKVFEQITGWNGYELKNINSAAQVLWPTNPS